MDKTKLEGIQSKIKWKIHVWWYIVFQVLKVLLIMKNTRLQLPYQFFYFLLFYISFNISRYHFLQLFRTSFNIFWKKIFVLHFPFLTDSPKPPTCPLNSQNLLSVAKFFCWCSLNLIPKAYFFLLSWGRFSIVALLILTKNIWYIAS